MPTIIAYAFESALHCVDCTQDRHAACAGGAEHGIPIDREGNRISPIFDTDSDADGEFCDDCRAPLKL